MVISARRSRMAADAARPEQPAGALPAAASSTAASPLAYEDFDAALRRALRAFHRPALLAANPLIGLGVGRLGAPAGPAELQAMLSEAVTTLFANPRDEKLRRVIELTYFHPAPK